MADSSSSLTVLWITQTELFAGCRSWSAASAVARAEFYSPRGRAKLASSANLKSLSSNASRGARWLGALPKNCHLLPSTAIYAPQIRYVRFNRCFSNLPLKGMSASLGPDCEPRAGPSESSDGCCHRVPLVRSHPPNIGGIASNAYPDFGSRAGFNMSIFAVFASVVDFPGRQHSVV